MGFDLGAGKPRLRCGPLAERRLPPGKRFGQRAGSRQDVLTGQLRGDFDG